MTLQVYGASDDLVILTGDGIAEEFYAPAAEERLFLTLSNGVVLCVEYGGVGEWTVSELYSPDDVDVDVRPVGEEDAPNDYTEVAYVEGGETVEWVLSTPEINRYGGDK